MIRAHTRRSFRGCRRRWNWSIREGYHPLVQPKPLEFGTAFHIAFEKIYDPDLWDSTNAQDKLERAKQAFKQACNEQRESYLLSESLPRLDREGQDDYDARIKLGFGMLEYYVTHVHVKEDHWFRPVKVEMEFEVPLTDERGKPLRCYSSPACGQIHEHGDVVVHGGRVDVIVEDIVRGGYYIIDWKTAAELRANADLLWMDDQLCTYCWALRFILNIDIRGFIYVEIRKDYPRRPAKLQRIRNGGMFSQNKASPTSYELYLKTVQEFDADAYAGGVYDDFLSFLKGERKGEEPPKFHQRFDIPKTDAELRSVGEALIPEVQDMIQDGVRIYPSTGRFSCPSCAFRSPCTMMFKGEDYRYTLDTMFQRTVLHAASANAN